MTSNKQQESQLSLKCGCHARNCRHAKVRSQYAKNRTSEMSSSLGECGLTLSELQSDMAAKSTSDSSAMDVKKMQIYPPYSPSSGRQVTLFWKEKYEKEAKNYWDLFYKRHNNKFFKDRHYLDKEWGRYFEEREKLVVLEAGCGVGNTIFPLVSTYPDIYIHACDFSPRAIDIVKAHDNFRNDQINAFVCDLTLNDLNDLIPSSSVDIVTLVFMLSAVAPEKMSSVVQNVKKVLKPNGYVLIRDYALGDLAQERLIGKEQQISENFYVRGDGTRAYYFSEDFLTNLFKDSEFDVKDISICSKQFENRLKNLVMNRRWIQAVFSPNSDKNTEALVRNFELEKAGERLDLINLLKDSTADTEIEVSESIADVFDSDQSFDEVIVIEPRGYSFRIRMLAREHQHTCKSTGLMLWESARLMCNVIAENPSIVAGKRILELGCGSAGICSMISAQFAEHVVSTDGDSKALRLLQENIGSNFKLPLIEKISIMNLTWGKKQDLQAIKQLGCFKGGFELILGTDISYVPEAISPLFVTAKELLMRQTGGESNPSSPPSLILCHIQRRVHEDSIVSAASNFGFKLVDRWANGSCLNDGIISSWFAGGASSCCNDFQNTPLTILYFEL